VVEHTNSFIIEYDELPFLFLSRTVKQSERPSELNETAAKYGALHQQAMQFSPWLKKRL
jgi:hypothetical protein